MADRGNANPGGGKSPTGKLADVIEFPMISRISSPEILPNPPFSASVRFYQANASAFVVSAVENIGKAETKRIVMEMLRKLR